jgi:hypothetical protein
MVGSCDVKRWASPLSLPGYVRIGLTADTVQPAHAAAIVEVGGDKLDVILRSMLNRCGRSMMGRGWCTRTARCSLPEC